MAKRRAALAAVAVAWLGASAVGACSSNDDSGADVADGGSFQVTKDYDADYDGCAAFSGNGTVCGAPSTQMCTSCECVCAQGPDGLRWACVVDSAACAAPFSGGGEDAGEDGSVGTRDGNAPPPVDSSKPDTSSTPDANEPPDTSVPPDANDSAAPPTPDAGNDDAD